MKKDRNDEGKRVNRNLFKPTYNNKYTKEYLENVNEEVDRFNGALEAFFIKDLSNELKNHYNENNYKNFTSLESKINKIFSIFSAKFFYDSSIGRDQRLNDYRKHIDKKIVRKFIQGTEKNNKKNFTFRIKKIKKNYRERPSNLIRDQLKSSFRNNLDLITDINVNQYRQIEKTIWNGIDKGVSNDTLIKEIQEKTLLSKKRAKLIVNDQAHKLNSDLDRIRLQIAGVNRYIWRTRQNAAVRPDHRKLEGSAYSFSEPPVTVTTGKRSGERNNPGQDINCFCWAEPIFN